MDSISMSYEENIKKQRQENREFLKTLGIYNLSESAEVKRLSTQTPKLSTKRVSRVSGNSLKATNLRTRQSSRLLGKGPAKYEEILSEIKTEIQSNARLKVTRENTFGAIPGVAVGTEFITRLEASHAGVHRPTVAGIHGNPLLGCYSLALSGGYEDDVDLGDSFIYTGEGGRDLKGTKANPKNLRTAPQSKDQVLERGNLALSKNIENKYPVRVIRGYKLRSEFAPVEGYRYDGLYNVEEYYISRGLSGFGVYKFRLKRIEDQEPAPWSKDYIQKKILDNAESSAQKENILKGEDVL